MSENQNRLEKITVDSRRYTAHADKIGAVYVVDLEEFTPSGGLCKVNRMQAESEEAACKLFEAFVSGTEKFLSLIGEQGNPACLTYFEARVFAGLSEYDAGQVVGRTANWWQSFEKGQSKGNLNMDQYSAFCFACGLLPGWVDKEKEEVKVG
ncbi:hypothetical protein [Domibacillus tundrae]|uniref:hypothetical protein n=1 Tax=Domibacillus tundrae TaxID=1587527 RepID=UPI000617B1B9|nr:hypothetical protein [Domibacillus tundrae]